MARSAQPLVQNLGGRIALRAMSLGPRTPGGRILSYFDEYLRGGAG